MTATAALYRAGAVGGERAAPGGSAAKLPDRAALPILEGVMGEMIPAIAEHAGELERLCRRHGVQRLDLFGSAATGAFRPGESDLDFLVEFQPTPSHGAYANAYFGLLEDLADLFGRPVDLVIESAIDNPYFRESVEESRRPVYAS